MKQTEDPAVHAAAPSEEAVRDELARVLASPYFEQAERSSAFLRFAVEQTLAGRARRLKGYTVAVEVFGRPDDFDAGTDPLVRVEAGRLRRRLLDYYANEGRRDPVRIELPVGGYVARFGPGEAEPQAGDGTPAAGTQPLRPRRAFLAIVTAFAAAVVAAVLWLPPALQSSMTTDRTGPVLKPQFAATPGPTIAVTGFANLSNNATLDAFAAGLTEELLVRLGASSLSVVPASTARHPSSKAIALYATNRAAPTGYVLTGTVRAAATSLRVSARLVDGRSGAQVWTTTLDAAASNEGSRLLASEEDVAAKIAATISSPFGPLFEREIERIGALPLDELDAYGCIVLLRAYARTLDPETHEQSRRCFLNVVTDEPQTAQSWAGLALLYQHEYWFGYGPAGDAPAALDRAREAAQTALDIDGDNVLANLAIAGLHYTDGDRAGFRVATQRSISLRTDPAALAHIGLLMVLSDERGHGVKMLDWAYREGDDVPSWYRIGYSFDAMLAGDYAAALDSARRTDTPNWFATPLAEAAAAGFLGDRDVAMRSVNRLLALKPAFAKTGYARLRAWIRNERLTGVLVEGLRRAGLSLEGASPLLEAPRENPPSYGSTGAADDVAR